MEPNQVIIEIEPPQIEFDEVSGLFLATLKAFPQISATGETHAQAEKHLLELVPILFAEYGAEVMETLLKQYVQQAKSTSINARIVENDHKRLLRLASV